MNDPMTLEAAEREAHTARARFLGTAAVMKERLEPVHLLADAVSRANCGLADLARSATERARRHPAVSTASLAAVAALLLRHSLFRMVRSVRRR